MSDIGKLLAAASQANGAALDLIECARDGGIRSIDNVAAGDTLACMIDGLKLLIDAMQDSECCNVDDETNQLHGALVRWLD